MWQDLRWIFVVLWIGQPEPTFHNLEEIDRGEYQIICHHCCEQSLHTGPMQ